MNDSIKLARLWAELKAIKDKLDNELIPIAGYLGMEDHSLMTAMEALSVKIADHFEEFKLTAVRIGRR